MDMLLSSGLKTGKDERQGYHLDIHHAIYRKAHESENLPCPCSKMDYGERFRVA